MFPIWTNLNLVHKSLFSFFFYSRTLSLTLGMLNIFTILFELNDLLINDFNAFCQTQKHMNKCLCIVQQSTLHLICAHNSYLHVIWLLASLFALDANIIANSSIAGCVFSHCSSDANFVFVCESRSLTSWRECAYADPAFLN